MLLKNKQTNKKKKQKRQRDETEITYIRNVRKDISSDLIDINVSIWPLWWKGLCPYNTKNKTDQKVENLIPLRLWKS